MDYKAYLDMLERIVPDEYKQKAAALGNGEFEGRYRQLASQFARELDQFPWDLYFELQALHLRKLKSCDNS